MKYQGGKARVAKKYAEIFRELRVGGQAYVEPFVGGGWVIQNMDGKRIAGDLHSGLIRMWTDIGNGWLPYKNIDLTEELYNEIKRGSRIGAFESFVGFTCSFAGAYFSTYARCGGLIDYYQRACRSMYKQAPMMRGIDFHCCSYDNLPIPDNSLIYCDPPYSKKRGYRGTGGFDSDKFWQWCIYMSKSGHTVIVSEFSCPDDICDIIYSKERKITANGNAVRSSIEYLYLVK